MRKKTVLLVLSVVYFFTGAVAMAENTTFDVFLNKLPRDINGWQRSAEPKIYTQDNLFEYINGGAELYISYRFERLLALNYVKGEGDGRMEIKLDIFDMGHSYNAFGVFVHGSETPDTSFGRGAEYAAGLLTFWKDRYYVSILAYPVDPEKEAVVRQLGRCIADSIPADGELPPIISLLPEENLVPHSIRYFYHYIWLNGYHYISGDNILNIGPDTPAALARYMTGDKRSRFPVMVISYPEEARAAEAVKNFTEKYLPGARDGVKQLNDGRWSACKPVKNLVVVVLNAPDRDTAASFPGKIKTQSFEKNK